MRTGDLLLAAALTVLTLATAAGQDDARLGVVEAVLAVLSVAPLALRQVAPVLTMSVVLAALAAYSLLDASDLPNGGIGMLIAMFTVGMLRSRAVAAVMFVASVLVSGFVFTSIVSPILLPELALTVLTIAVAWVLGDSTGRWARRNEKLAAQAAGAAAEERVRLARELHDVVAHHMSLISLQAGVASYVIDNDPPAAKRAIAVVGDTGREALTEMRRMLDVLRADEDLDDDGLHPQPGLGDLDALLERVRAAGLPVTLTRSGPSRALPSGADLCAYRVVQESLTNVLRHAGPARATVALEYDDGGLHVTVRDDGAGRPRRSSGGGLGIRGMRERAALYDGTLEAGPAPDGGFAVKLWLPFEEEE